MDRFVEQPLAPALGALAVAGILRDIGDQARIEDALPIVCRIKTAVQIEIGPSEASPFNIVIAGRAARTSTYDRHARIRCLEAALLCNRIEIGRGNVSTHVESPGHRGKRRTEQADVHSNSQLPGNPSRKA